MKNSKPRLRLAVFDCDGTLVDSAHSIIACMQTACKNMGHPSPDKADIRRTVGLSVEVAITKIFPDMEINKVLSVREEFHRLFGKLRDLKGVHEPLYPGVDKTLSALNDAGWLLGVATGKSSKGLKLTLTNHNLHHHFVTLQTADISIGKPDPDMLLKAIRDAGVEKKRTVMIGDTSFDMDMARNAGTLAIGVTWGYHNVEELFDSGAHGVVKNFSQLPQAMENLLRNNR